MIFPPTLIVSSTSKGTDFNRDSVTLLTGKFVGGSPGNDPIGNILDQGVNATQPSAFVEDSDNALAINVFQGQAVTSIYSIFISATWAPPASTQGQIWVNEGSCRESATVTIGPPESN